MTKMADNSETILEDLSTIYQPLEGESFEATYLGRELMPQTGNERLKLEVNSTDPLEAKLKEISSNVLQKPYGKEIWKGITGPEDSLKFTHYWIWVKSESDLESLDEDTTYQFKIAGCTPFKCYAGDFSYGVDIEVNRDEEAIM